MKILLGLTGSVATTLAPKIVKAMEETSCCRNVAVVMTDKARMFWDPAELSRKAGVKVYTEQDEWTWRKEIKATGNVTVRLAETCRWEKDFPILHVELAKRSSCLVIAPASMNTIAKMANGITDNLLTSVFAAWRADRPVIIAPSMNTLMWNSIPNQKNLQTLADMDVHIVMPAEKELACGDVGMGAMADISDILKAVNEKLAWHFPVALANTLGEELCPGVPVGKHPGSFGFVRKFDVHCGVDLYCRPGMPVSAVETGTIVSIEDFTGPNAGCGWWLETKAVKIEGASGVVCYGEISPYPYLHVGMRVRAEEIIGEVTPVLRPEKLRKDIPGHSCSMLHFQMYEHGSFSVDDARGEKELPSNVIDPTPFLLAAHDGNGKQLEMPSC